MIPNRVHIRKRRPQLAWGLAAAMVAFGLSACDSGLETDPRPAEIEILSSSTAKVCQETELRAKIRDVNGIDVIRFFIDDALVTFLPGGGTQRTVSNPFTFEIPNRYRLKVAVVDRAGDTSENSTWIDVGPDSEFDYLPMDVGKTYSFHFSMDGRRINAGGVPPRQLEGTLDWEVVGSTTTSTGSEHTITYHFVGERRDYDWFAPGWGEWMEFTDSGTGVFEESKDGIVGGGGPFGFGIARPVPRYNCLASPAASNTVLFGGSRLEWTVERRFGIRSLYERFVSAGTDIDYTLTAEE